MSTVKPFQTIEEQIEILKSRGLIIDDYPYAVKTLREINYYRLSGYTLTLRKGDQFYPYVRLEDIVQIYYFDSELRTLLLHLLDHIELKLRTQIGYVHGKRHGPLGYIEAYTYQNPRHFRQFISNFEKSIQQNQNEVFVQHHETHRNSQFPVWVAMELLSFGSLSKFFNNMDPQVQLDICREYYCGIPVKYISNWLHCLTTLRNLCAHRSRLYNRGMTVGMLFSKPEQRIFQHYGYDSQSIGKELFFYIVIIDRILFDEDLRKLLWTGIEDLTGRYPFVMLKHYGFQDDWRELRDELNSKYQVNPV